MKSFLFILAVLLAIPALAQTSRVTNLVATNDVKGLTFTSGGAVAPAGSGVIRLGNGEMIAWEASPAGTDLTLTVNSSEQFVFSAAILSPTLITPDIGAATGTSAVLSGLGTFGGNLIVSGAAGIQFGTTAGVPRIGEKIDMPTVSNYGGISLSTWSATAAHESLLEFNRSKSATIGTFTTLATSDALGTINWRGADGTSMGSDAASIKAVVNGTVTTGHMPTDLVFFTSDAAVQSVERMRVKAAGGVTLQGTKTNDAAAAGFIGELLTAQLAAASTTSLVTATGKTITSVSLTAGDWEVSGTVHFIPANTTVVASLIASVSAADNTQASVDSVGGYASIGAVYTSGGATMSATPIPVRISLAATTTYYLVATATFSISTSTGYGTLRARRLR